MHFEIKGSSLISNVTTVERAIATIDQNPSLTGILISANNNQLTLTANNLQIAIQTKTECTIFEPGEHIVDGRLFSQLVRKLPNDNVIIQYTNNQVLISAATMEFSLNTITTEEFPEYPDCTEQIFTLTDYELNRLIKFSSFASSNDDHQPIFSGVLMEIENNDLQFVATDSNRLAYVKAETGETFVEEGQFIIPKANVQELLQCLPLTETKIDVLYGHNQLAFRFDNTIFTTRLIDGKFPNYKNVIFTEQKTSLVIKRQQFIQALERASLFGRVEKVPVIIRVTDGVLEIETTSKLGQSQEQYNVEQNGPNEKAAFSPKFILDMLKTMEDDQVEFRYEGARQALIKSTESNNRLYIIMPIRI